MKISKLITAILSGAIIFSSCADWLEVNPQTQIKESELFRDEDGFKLALTGVYIGMAGKELYGRNTSYYLPELLSHTWYYTVDGDNQMSRFSEYKYMLTQTQLHQDDENLIGEIWLTYYNLIAQLNNILTNLESSTVNFTPGIADVIRGESLGLRAYLHFEVLRLFGKNPAGADRSEKAIPYVTTMNRTLDELTSKSLGEILDAIAKDLQDALESLAKADPILGDDWESISSDDWLAFRQSRFNYYAALATMARFALWTGDNATALGYARQIIESEKFTLADNNSYDNYGNLVFLSENIFNVVNPDHDDWVLSDFTEEDHKLKLTEADFKAAYESSTNPNDIRAVQRRYWTTSIDDRYISYLKYTGSTGANIRIANTIPLIRLSEMYLMVMETGSLSEAAAAFQTYRISRILSASLETDFNDEVTRMERVEKEFRKEFFAEGQMFYFYKRNNYAGFSWPTDFKIPDMSLYAIPKPLKQRNYE